MDRREAEYYAKKQANMTERVSYVIKKDGKYDFIHKAGLESVLKHGWERVETVYPRGM